MYSPSLLGPPPGWYEMNVGVNESMEYDISNDSPPAERRTEGKQVSRDAAKGWANALDETCSCDSARGAFEKCMNDASIRSLLNPCRFEGRPEM